MNPSGKKSKCYLKVEEMLKKIQTSLNPNSEKHQIYYKGLIGSLWEDSSK
jgi:hypothetical protein